MIEAYPLYWPIGYPRSNQQVRSRFDPVSLGVCRNEMLLELKRFHAKDIIISTNFPLRKDGLFQATAPRGGIADQGVAVYFTLEGERMVLCCDKWHNIASNIIAITKTIYAMRGMDRWGVSDMIKRAFTGFKALPEPKGWWDILGVDKDASEDEIKRAYRKQAMEHHPDRGGNIHQFNLINAAYNKGLSQAI